MLVFEADKMNFESALIKEITSIHDNASSKLIDSTDLNSANGDNVKIICQVDHYRGENGFA